jgi:hypothetical protein
VRLHSQAGTTLVEVVVATGIFALAVGAALGIAAPAVRTLAPDPRDAALQQLVRRELATASDLLKYDGTTLAPNAIATTVPLPGATPLPVSLSLAVRAIEGATVVTITANADGRTTSQTATIASRAPQPGSTIAPAVLVPAPTGAP